MYTGLRLIVLTANLMSYSAIVNISNENITEKFYIKFLNI